MATSLTKKNNMWEGGPCKNQWLLKEKQYYGSIMFLKGDYELCGVFAQNCTVRQEILQSKMSVLK